MAKILIVDDDLQVRDLIKDILDMHGHDCQMATTGLEALNVIKKTRFDIVVLDRNMPEMNGIQFLKNIRSIPEYKKLKVLMCTSADKMADVQEALESGANDYVVKPLDLGQLAGKVAALSKKE